MPYDDLPPENEGCLPPLAACAVVALALLWLLCAAGCQTPPPNVTSTTDGVHSTVIVTYPPQKDLVSQLLDTAVTYGKSIYQYFSGL
jgi:hypothetical protein